MMSYALASSSSSWTIYQVFLNTKLNACVIISRRITQQFTISIINLTLKTKKKRKLITATNPVRDFHIFH